MKNKFIKFCLIIVPILFSNTAFAGGGPVIPDPTCLSGQNWGSENMNLQWNLYYDDYEYPAYNNEVNNWIIVFDNTNSWGVFDGNEYPFQYSTNSLIFPSDPNFLLSENWVTVSGSGPVGSFSDCSPVTNTGGFFGSSQTTFNSFPTLFSANLIDSTANLKTVAIVSVSVATAFLILIKIQEFIFKTSGIKTKKGRNFIRK